MLQDTDGCLRCLPTLLVLSIDKVEKKTWMQILNLDAPISMLHFITIGRRFQHLEFVLCISLRSHTHNLRSFDALPGPNPLRAEVSRVLGSVVSITSELKNSDSEMEAQENDTCLSRVLLAISQKQLPVVFILTMLT